MFEELQKQYRLLESDFQRRSGQVDILQQKSLSLSKQISELETNTSNTEQALLFLQALSDQTRHQVIDKINDVVTDAIQHIKDPNLKFKMELSIERGQSDIKFYIVDLLTGQSYDILNSCGGGLADLTAFALRLCLLVRWPQPIRRFLLLDETLKFIGVSDQEMLGDFIRELSEKLGIQMLFITHSSILNSKVHRSYKVTKAGTESTVELQGINP